jgi:hypothetical protein
MLLTNYVLEKGKERGKKGGRSGEGQRRRGKVGIINGGRFWLKADQISQTVG